MAIEYGTTWICGSHRRLATPVRCNGEDRVRHSGPGDQDWCGSQRFTQRDVSEVDRGTVLAALTGETQNHSAKAAATREDEGHGTGQ
jgi:hypothetical protein